MGKILAIAWKDTLVRFSSRTELLFFIVLPVLFTVIVGGMMAGGEGDDRIPLAVVNADGGELSRAFLSELASSEAVSSLETSLAEAEAMLDEQSVPALLVIPRGFEAALRAGEPVELDLRVAPNNITALAAEQAVLAAAAKSSRLLIVARSSVQAAETIRPFDSQVDRAVYFDRSLEQAREMFAQAPQRVQKTQPAASPAREIDIIAVGSVGQLITWVFIPLLGTSVLFAYERAAGTLRRLLTMPTRKWTFLLGTISGQLAASLVQMALLVVFGILVMKVSWGNSPAALGLMLVSFGLASVALGTMLATFVKTESQANGLSVMLGMTMALLGGCWYPIELFPEAVRTAVKVLPTTWAMQGMLDIVTRGDGLAETLPEAGVLLGFAVVFFFVGVRRFRFE